MNLSIIIPVHNAEKFLENCIQSVLNEMPEDEIILVENGSTDHSYDICKSYAEKYDSVQLIQLENVGVSVARNEGIKAAKRKWVTFLDADDQIQIGGGYLSTIANETDADVLIAGYRRELIDSPQSMIVSRIDADLLAKGVLQFAKYRKRINESADIDSYNNWACWGKIYKRTFLLDNHIEFPEGVRLSEDAAFCFQVYCTAERVFATKQIAYYYNKHSGSSSQGYIPWYPENNITLVKHFESYRRKYSIAKNWNMEFAVFYITKIYEVVFRYLRNKKCELSKFEKKKIIKKICEIPEFNKAIKEVPLSNLGIGKRDKMIYFIMIICLRLEYFDVLVK